MICRRVGETSHRDRARGRNHAYDCTDTET